MTVSDALPAYPGFTFGCDPELFLLNEKGVNVSAHEYLPGDKSEPYALSGGAVHVDGTAAEITIDPAESFEQFLDRIKSVKGQILKMLPKGFKFSPSCVAVYSEEEWEKIPYENKELGCQPDFNAWTGDVNPPPHDPDNPRMRTASGHLHIGWTDGKDTTDSQHLANCRDLVKQLDYYLGAWSVIEDPEPRRRRLYGKAGAMRYKPYGVEYRVLSNFWLDKPAKTKEVWNRMQTAITDMKYSYMPTSGPAKWNFNGKLISSINESNLDPKLRTSYSYPIETLRR